MQSHRPWFAFTALSLCLACSGGQSGTEAFEVRDTDTNPTPSPEAGPDSGGDTVASPGEAAADAGVTSPTSEPDASSTGQTPVEVDDLAPTRAIEAGGVGSDPIAQEQYLDFYLEPCETREGQIWCSRISTDGSEFSADDAFWLADYEWGYVYHLSGYWEALVPEPDSPSVQWVTGEILSKDPVAAGTRFGFLLDPVRRDRGLAPHVGLTDDTGGEILAGPTFSCHPAVCDAVARGLAAATPYRVTFEYAEELELSVAEVVGDEFKVTAEVEQLRDAWLSKAPAQYVVKACPTGLRASS